MMRFPVRRTIFLTLCLFSFSVAAETWLRVSDPDPSFRDALPAEAIDYGGFVWVSEDAAPRFSERARVQRVDNPFRMTAGDRTFDPLTDFPQSDNPWYRGNEGNDPDFHLIQFQGPIKGRWLEDLRSMGLDPIRAVHPFSWIVWGSPDQVQSSRSLERVRWVGQMLPAFRVPIQARRSEMDHPYAMALVYRPEAAPVTNAMMQAGARIRNVTPLGRQFSIINMLAEKEIFLDLARIPGVYTVQHISQDAGPRNEMANQSIVGNIDGEGDVFPGYLTWLNDAGLDGTGVTVGIVDGGVRESHQDLVDNMGTCVSDGGSPTTCTTSNNSHGTHVAGAVGGSGASGITDSAGFLRGQGVAPGATLVQQRYNEFIGSGPGGMIPDGMLTIFKESALSGALHTNNSWGPTGDPQGYDVPTMEIDIISRDANPDEPGQQPVLAVWSIMNGNGDDAGACAPSSLGSPDEAKNLFGVGSTNMQTGVSVQSDDLFSVSGNSGHGPACDGRLVPQIVAPGCSTDSTESASDTAFGLKCGTSMASPIVSGAVAIFAERYNNQHGELPSPALVKAMFTAVATDLVGNTDADGGTLGHRPDRKQGWGRIDLDAVINPGVPVETVNQTEVFTSTGDNWTQTFTPDDPTEPMRIMLAWTDAPGHGQGGTQPAWVNDLDLIGTIGGDTYYGNNISLADGFSEAGGAPDEMNNLEGIILSPAQHQGGGVDVEVLAANLADDALDPWNPSGTRQDFALACYNCLTEPGFSVALDPSDAMVCTPDSVSTNVEIGSILGYDDDVTLSVVSTPANVNASFTQTTVTPPGNSQLDIDINAGAPAGAQTVVIEGDSTAGPQERTFGLNIFDDVPAAPNPIAPADDATDVALVPTLEWDVPDQTQDFLVELATDSGFGDVIFTDMVTDPAVTLDFALAPETTYYWRVRADNLCGMGTVSTTFEFTTRPIPPLLLVDDDDNSPDVQPIYTAALDALNMDYDVWDTDNSDNEPDFTELAPYRSVVWFTGDEFGDFAGPGPDGETALGTYIDGGGCLMLSSQDYHFDRDLTDFMTGYLGVESVTNDEDHQTTEGVGDQFGALGDIPMDYDAVDVSNFSDTLNVGNGGEAAFLGDNDAVSGTLGPSGRTVWTGYPLSAIASQGDLEAVLQTFFNSVCPLEEEIFADGFESGGGVK